MTRLALLVFLTAATLCGQSATDDTWGDYTVTGDSVVLAEGTYMTVHFDQRRDGSPCQPNDTVAFDAERGNWYCTPGTPTPAPIRAIVIDAPAGLDVRRFRVDDIVYITIREADEQ